MTDKNDTTTEADLRRRAYNSAVKILREKYAEEFRAIVTAEATKLGVRYSFRPTKEERAAAQIEQLLAENPGLAARFQP